MNNRIKTVIYILTGIIIGVVLASALSPAKMAGEKPSKSEETQKDDGRKIKYWTCSMHPQVRMDHFDQCPICGMDLIPVYEESGDGGGDATLTLGERARKLASIQTEPIGRRKLVKEIHAVARIDYDETKVAYISAWYDGRIDKLYADFTGIEVKKGARLALLYSPQLISAQQEYLLTYKSRGLSARSKLLLLGITPEQIDKIETAGKPLNQLEITSPIKGTVISKNVKEGQYVKTGNLIYTIADLSNLWISLEVYEYDLPWIKVSQKADITVEAFPDEEFEGIITFIDPFLNEKTRSVKVRVDMKNPGGKLKPGMFASGHIHNVALNNDGTEQHETLAVRKEAVLDTGIRKIVYVELDKGKYEMREIVTGPLADGYYPVESGLGEGEAVVVSGNFLIDSQMQLSGKPSIMFPKGLEGYDPHADMGHSGQTDMDDDMNMNDITFDELE